MSSREIPRTWAWACFSDVASIASNLVDPGEFKNLPHLAPDNIERDTGHLLPVRTIEEDGVTSPKHLFKPGQLVYSKIRPYLNKCVRVGFEGLCSADMYPLEVHVTRDFLFHYMLSREFVSEVGLAAGSRTVLPKTNQKQLSGVSVPVAPFLEQHRIVAAIESYLTRLDDAVASLERVQKNLKRYRASVLKAAVEGRLVPTEADLARKEGRDYEPASVLLERILKERRRRWEKEELAKMKAKGKEPKNDKWKEKYKEPVAPDTSDLPELPEGWCWTSVEQLSTRVSVGHVGKTSAEYVANGIPFVRSQNVRPGHLDLRNARQINQEFHARLRKSRLEGGDVLVVRVGANRGDCCMVPGGLGELNCANIVFFRPILGTNSYSALYLRSQPGENRLLGETTGSAQGVINTSSVATIPVPLPPLAEQQRLTVVTDQLLSVGHATAVATNRAKARIQRLRQSILKWAFEGKLVDQDPTDEPASVLLERIKAERAALAAEKKATMKKIRRKK